MKAIVTRANMNNTFDEVGMRNRTVLRGCHRNIVNKVQKMWPGTRVRIEFYSDSIYAEPISVMIVKTSEVKNAD